MKSLQQITEAILIVFLFCAVQVARGQLPSPQKQLKTYALPIGTQSADISPDERFVVTDVYAKNQDADAGTNPYSDLIQLWNFKGERVVANYSMPSPGVRVYARHRDGGYYTSPPLGMRVVRFSPDGTRVAALIGDTIHLLRSSDLKELRAIQLIKPADIWETHHAKSYASGWDISSMELAPEGDVASVLWVREHLYGRVQLYDLSTGAMTTSWDTPKGSIQRELVWHPSGKLLLVNVPYEPPCRNAINHPDIFVLDALTGTVKSEITTGLQVGDFAVSTGSRVLAVQNGCFHLTRNSDPQLVVFDLNTGKQVRTVPARKTGIRYSVSVSADGSRFLAFTGASETKFDWLDGTTYGASVDDTFSVWNLTNYGGILTSQSITGLHNSKLKISSRGNFALSYGRAAFVYELP